MVEKYRFHLILSISIHTIHIYFNMKYKIVIRGGNNGAVCRREEV